MPDPTRVVLNYRTVTARLRARLLGAVQRAWLGLPDYRDADIERFVDLILPVVTGGQRQVANLTSAYLAQFDQAVTGIVSRPQPVPREIISDLRGVALAEVYQRPGRTVWFALSEGVPFNEAIQRGLDRALNLAASDLQLAKTHTFRQLLAGRKDIVGYRRVLEGTKSCGLCIVASTQRYHKGDLMPIHGGCDCGVQPIYGKNDPGQIIEPERLTDVHDRIAERFGSSDAGARDPIDYRRALITHQHGELGPVLAVKGQHFATAP